MSYLRFEHITKKFGKETVLQNISLEINKGKLITLLGPSGCGKSTFLRCLAGLEVVDNGKIYLHEDNITHVPPQKRGISMVFQQYSLFPNLTVGENIAFGLKVKKISKDKTEMKVKNFLEIIGLEDKKNAYPRELSGGQQQRVALARALVVEPKVLLLDEPLSAIDAQLRKTLQIEIRRIQKQLEITTIFVTHDQDEAMVMSDEIYLMNEGQIEQHGKPMELYRAPATKFAADFMGNYNVLSAEEFENVTEYKANTPYVALRPESLQLKVPTEEYYQFQGIIIQQLHYGNIIRYVVDCCGTSIQLETLFMPENLLVIGKEINIYVNVSDVIFLKS